MTEEAAAAVRVRPVTVDRMAVLLDDPCGVLVIDSRPFLAFNAGHVRTAHNVHCPTIVRRRCGPRLPLENVVRCPEARDRLRAGSFGAVVVYDHRTSTDEHGGLAVDAAARRGPPEGEAAGQTDDDDGCSNLRLVLESLLSLLPQSIGRTVFFLNGGFESFAKENEHLIIRDTTTLALNSDNSPLSSSSSSPSSSSSSSSSSRKRTYAMTSLTNSPPDVSNACKLSIGGRQLLNAVAVKTLKASDTSKWHFSQDKGDPTEVLPWLYLGNAQHALQESGLRRLGILALLNVAEGGGGGGGSGLSADGGALPADTFCHMNLPIADSSTSDILCKFPQAIDFIENVRLSGGKVLVHCLAGISRSPAICMAYLMFALHLSLDDAHDFLKVKRHLISPNLNFMRQLSEFESVLTVDRQRNSADVTRIPMTSSSASSAASVADDMSQAAAAAVAEGGGGCSRKRPRPSSLSFAASLTSSSTSVPMTPCTKQAGFGFDFSSVAVGLKLSPTVSQSPLLSPI